MTQAVEPPLPSRLVPTATDPPVPALTPWVAPTPYCNDQDTGWCCNSNTSPCPSAFPPVDASVTNDQPPALAYDSQHRFMWLTVPDAFNIAEIDVSGTSGSVSSPIGLLPIDFMSFGQDPGSVCDIDGPGPTYTGYPCAVNEETTAIAVANGIPYTTVGEMGDSSCYLGWTQIDEYNAQQMKQYGPNLSMTTGDSVPVCDPGAMAFDNAGDLWVTKQLRI